MSNNHIIELKAFNPPKAVESRQDNWVKYGENNNYYQFLIDRYNNSTTNNQVINNIVKLIYGKGLDAKDAGRKPSEYAQMKMLFSKEVTKKAITDMYLLGQCALQVIYAKNKKTIVAVEHIPVHNLRPEKCNKDGIIENYYYSDNWANLREFPATPIPSFGNGNQTLEILMIGNYTIGQKYFSNVSYLGGLAYAQLEEDIAEFLISLIQTNFSPLSIINFNNSETDVTAQGKIVESIKTKATGASGDKLIVSFNSDETKKTTIDSVPLNRAAEQYQYLSDEARAKIMLSHGVTSGLLFGIPSANGFSSNADELKTAFVLFDNNVIIPNQEQFCDGIDKILAFNKISLDLTFIPLKSLDDTSEISASSQANKVVVAVNTMSPLVANKVLESMTPDEIRSLIGLPPVVGGALLAPVSSSNFSEIDFDEFGETIDSNEWELIDSQEVDYDNEDFLDAELKKLNEPSLLRKVLNFVSTGVAIPNAKSEQDGVLFKSRYRYMSQISDKSRPFCVKMHEADKVYRKEDIMRMSNMEVNKGWGPKGADTYDIFLYKGGGNCHCKWNRETYRKKADVNSPNADKITPSEARKQGEILPTNNPLVYTRPIDMPNNGFLPK